LLPDIGLVKPARLASCRGGTFYIPETLFLHIDSASPINRTDDALITLIHEGVHWRQFQATTFGAFFNWILLSRELNTFDHFKSAPQAEMLEAFERRRDGVPILQLSRTTSLPKPALVLGNSRDRIALARMIWYDHTFTYRFFLNSGEISQNPDSAQQIFAAAIADAASTLTKVHPAWKDYGYEDVQRYYSLERVGRVAGRNGIDLTTRDLLEAAALANEVLLKSWTEEIRFHLTDEAAAKLSFGKDPGTVPGIHATSVWKPRDGLDRYIFLEESNRGLASSYGHALQVLFSLAGLQATRHESWLTALAVIDFALNGPLPPAVLPNRRQPDWWELYPPARFLKASSAVRKCGDVRPPYGNKEIAEFQTRVADASSLSNPGELKTSGVFDLIVPDFREISRGDVWDSVLGKPIAYYHFLRWCQQRLWGMRSDNLGLLVEPALWIWKAMWSNMPVAATYFAGNLGFTSPVQMGPDGEIEHVRGSTPAFGTWLAASRAIHYATSDLMVGTGEPDFRAFPRSLMENETVARLVLTAVRDALGISYDPWTCE